jgi:quinolinate synthase
MTRLRLRGRNDTRQLAAVEELEVDRAAIPARVDVHDRKLPSGVGQQRRRPPQATVVLHPQSMTEAITPLDATSEADIEGTLANFESEP